MRNKANPGGAPLGPKNSWAEWRERKNKRLTKPVRSVAAKRLNEPKDDEPASTSLPQRSTGETT